MASSVSLPRIAVLGGGILGFSTAVQLLRGGAEVVLVTEAEPASGASGRSLSWLNSGGGYGLDYHHLRMAGLDRYRTLLARHPGIDWLRFDGGLSWAAPGNEEEIRTRQRSQADRGYDAHLLSPEQAAEVAPAIDPDSLPGVVLFNPGEGWVSLESLIDHLVAEFRQLGGQLVSGAGPVEVLRNNDGAAAGVRTATGTYGADAVLLAAGAGTPDLLKTLGVDVPDGSDLAMLVLTEPLEHGLTAVLNTPRVSVRPHPGGRLAMDHTWYLDRITPTGDGGWSVDPDVARELAAEASEILAGHPEVVPAQWRIGLKPVPGDGEPVLGELAQVPGCFVAFTHSGATLGLIAGELLAGEILTGRKHPLLGPFRPERFAG